MKWIDQQADFDQAMARIGSHGVIAVDTEADSLHSYFDKTCLIQISVADADYVVDPLTKIDLAKFGALLADPSITKVLHGGDYDVRILDRDFGFGVHNLIDTSICAQLLGYDAFGLAALLEKHFGVKLNKVHQRADWSMRPLSADMLEYAALDTHYLIALAAKLRDELTELGRWEWAVEEFSRLESVRHREREESEETWRKLKNLGNLDRRSLAIIRDLHAWRDVLAREADKPPFKVIGNDALIDIAREKPQSPQDLSSIKSVSRYHSGRFGKEIARIVRAAMEIDEAALPEKNDPKPWIRDRQLEARINRMKAARDKIARELKIDAAILAPRHVLAAIATSGNLDEAGAMREWQKKVAGEALLAAMNPAESGNRKLF
jgi:ribonuclease D